MSKLDFSDKKILNLKNVISKEYISISELEDQKHLKMLVTYLQSQKIETFGPVIFYSSGVTGIDKEGKPIFKNKVMIQCKEIIHRSICIPYINEGNIRIEDCLYVRFNDSLEKLFFSSNKLTLYAYENDIELEGGSYSIVLEENKETKKVILDLFMPIKKRISLEKL